MLFVNKAIGIVMIIAGVLLIIFFKSGYRYNNQGALLCKKSKEWSKKCQQSVLDFLNGKSQELKTTSGNDGGTILLEAWYNKTENIAYAQLFVFEDLHFQKATDLVELQSSKAQQLIEELCRQN